MNDEAGEAAQVRADGRALGDNNVAGEANPLKKPLPIPRDSIMPGGDEPRESVWFFQDEQPKK